MRIKELIENESGVKFNKLNKCNCPFHKDKTPSLAVKNEKWKCFSCGRGGDNIDFIREYKNLPYVQACKYLGLELNELYSKAIEEEENLKGYINWQIKNIGEFKSWSLIKLYRFEDENNKTLYFKAKFSTPGKKEIRYYSFENDKIKMTRGSDEVPYNNYNLIRALAEKRSIWIVEGEKDADTLIYMGYTATSFKGMKAIDETKFKDAIVYFIGDTGRAGEEYKQCIYNGLKEHVQAFRVVDIPGMEELGDNADITDWFKIGHTKEDFKIIKADYWDLKKNYYFKYVDVKNKPLKIWQNLEILLKSNGIKVKYNELTKSAEYIGASIDKQQGNNAILEDIFSICVRNGFTMSKDNITGALNKIAKNNSFNPVRDYLDKCHKEWNGYKGNIKALAETIVTPEDYDDKAKELFVFKWLLNVANIPYNTGGYGTEGILVIQGDQGIGKTRWINSIIPNPEWVKTGLEIDPSDKDKVYQATKYWVTELGELDATLKKDQAKLKAFFTEKIDEYRKPFERFAEVHPRLTAFYATVNKEEFLKDETGNRRYWTIPAVEMIINHHINIDSLWGEVMYYLKDVKFSHWLTDDDKELLKANNEKFEVKDDTYIKIQDSFRWESDEITWNYLKASEIGEVLNIKNLTGLGLTLKKFGIKKVRRAAGYYYHMPPVVGGAIIANELRHKWH